MAPAKAQLLVLATLAILFTAIGSSSAETVTLYNHTNHFGDFVLLNIKGCSNVPQKWRSATSSIDVHGSCLVFYDDYDCVGKRVTLQPHHRKYMMNLDTLGFNDIIKSIRPCGAKIQKGVHVIQSPVDGTVLTLAPQKGEFFANTEMTYWRRSKSQLWQINRFGPKVGVNYDLTPINFPFYNPITFTKFEAKKNQLGETYMPRRFYDILPLPDNKYQIKILHTDKCLVNNGRGKPIGKTVCAPWLPNQQWQFIRIDRATGVRPFVAPSAKPQGPVPAF